ncbi:MAG: response regulator [Natronomonas sp.]
MTSDQTQTSQPTVLVVDDESAVVDAYSLWLSDGYEILTAEDGEAALAVIDDTVDVVLLDRRMPNMNGDETLEAIREQGYGCRVAMVTGVDPGFDIVEMAFDAYLTKPVDGTELNEVVERLLKLSEYDKTAADAFSIAEKKAALETELTAAELSESDEYARLEERLGTLRERSQDAIHEMDSELFAQSIESSENHG